MEKEFVTWLIQQINALEWGNSELARRAQLAPSTVSMVLSRQKRPGLNFCVGIARALNKPPEQILRLAGLLPSKPEADSEVEEAVHLFEQLREDQRKYVLQTLRALAKGNK